MPKGMSFCGLLRFLGGGGDRVEADVGEEDDGAAGEDAAESGGRERNPVGFVHQAAADDEEERDGGDLDGDHGVVDLGGFAHAAHQQPAQDHDHEKGGNVEVGAGPFAVGPDGGRPALGQDEAELRELRLEVSGKADADGDVADGVFEDEIPADDPGEDFAESGVAVGVGRAGDGDHGGQLGVAEAGEGAGDGDQDEGDGDGGAGGGAAMHERAVQIAVGQRGSRGCP